ncbi:glycosyl hydrolases family 31-domain-containing protein [Desarmillaria ectypa]|nr:glycosyl hydrolases family 31-domain-containing protein [Desarmillaria ectypa]
MCRVLWANADGGSSYDRGVLGPSENITVNEPLICTVTINQTPSRGRIDVNTPPVPSTYTGQLGLGFGVLSINALATHATHVNGTAELDIHRHFTWKEAGHHQPSRLSLPLESKTLGNNYSLWQYMYHSIHGILQFQLFQIPFVGANACGFNWNPDEELCNRWMQLAAFTPFYRNHNIKDAISQEPYCWDCVASTSRAAILLHLHPIHECTGTSPVRPLLFEFLDEKELLGINKQFLIYNHEVVNATSGGNTSFSVPLGHINVHVRDGVAILLHEEPAYTIEETRQGPYSPLVSLSSDSFASGSAYIDDGVTAPPTPNTTLAFSVSESRLVIAPIGNFNASQRPRSWM